MNSSPYNYVCPHCQQEIPGTLAQAGSNISCPNCGQRFLVPAVARPAGSGGSPLMVPLVVVSVLLAGAIAGLVWKGQRPESAASAPNAVEPTANVPPAVEPKAAPEAKAGALSTFDATAAHLDRGGSFYLFVDTASWLSDIGKQLETWKSLAAMAPSGGPQDKVGRESLETGFAILEDVVTKSGLEQISAIGASSRAVEPGVYVNKLFIHHSGKGNGFLWSTFGEKPHHLELVDLLPTDTALAISSDVNLTDLIPGLREEVAKSGVPNATQVFDNGLLQFTAMTGMPLEDLFKSFDGSMGMILTLNQAKKISVPVEDKALAVPTPRLAILLHVKDDRIFNLIDKSFGAAPGVQKHDSAELRVRTMEAPIPNTEWFRPTVAQWTQGYLLIASDEGLVNDVVAAQKTGQGFKSTPQFSKLMAGLPPEGNAIQIVTPAFTETMRALQQEALKGQADMTPDQKALMEKLFGQSMSSSPGAMCSVSTHLEDGWLIASRGSYGLNMMLGPAAVVPVAIAAGVALPVFSQVQERGKATKSLSNGKQIVTACKLYAIDNNGKYPPNLDVLVPDYIVDKSTFISPFKPEEPVGYKYTPGHTDTEDPKIIVLEDKFSPEKGMRVVVHLDTAAEMIKVPKGATP
jgi:DNA-directed RNA polymerase subunit RPC12/RpoP